MPAARASSTSSGTSASVGRGRSSGSSPGSLRSTPITSRRSSSAAWALVRITPAARAISSWEAPGANSRLPACMLRSEMRCASTSCISRAMRARSLKPYPLGVLVLGRLGALGPFAQRGQQLASRRTYMPTAARATWSRTMLSSESQRYVRSSGVARLQRPADREEREGDRAHAQDGRKPALQRHRVERDQARRRGEAREHDDGQDRQGHADRPSPADPQRATGRQSPQRAERHGPARQLGLARLVAEEHGAGEQREGEERRIVRAAGAGACTQRLRAGPCRQPDSGRSSIDFGLPTAARWPIPVTPRARHARLHDRSREPLQALRVRGGGQRCHASVARRAPSPDSSAPTAPASRRPCG